MPVIMKLGVLSGLSAVLNSNSQLQQDISNLMFAQKADVQNIDWSKAKVFVPSDPTAVKWIVGDIKEITETLPDKQSTSAKPAIAYLGGNNGKYNKNSLETRLATLLCKANGYDLTPFKDGIESEIIHQAVAEKIPDSKFRVVELEKESSNSKQNWENALKKGMLDSVKTIVVIASAEGAARHIGTLKATLKAHNINPDDFNIVAYPYTATISADNLKSVQKELEINMAVPKDGGKCDKDNWSKSAWGLYRTFIEMNSLKRYSAKGDVYLTAEQKQLLNNIFSVKTLAFALGKTVVTEMKKAPKKLANLLNKER